MYHGDYAPAPELSYLKAVAAALAHADEILLASHGTGKSDAAAALEKYLKEHSPSVLQRIVGHAHLSEGHVTHRELIAAGRQFFSME